MIKNFLKSSILTASAVLLLSPGQGQTEELYPDVFSLEELSSMGLSNAPKSVTASTAAKVTQTTASSPSVIRIVTDEDIRTYGYRTFDDILRSLPGLYTTNDGLNTYLGVRGLGRPGDYNTRVLILIDGIRVNDNIFDSALVGREFPLDVELIERVEYAPGPGSAIYGKNAFFGVINVLTKSGNTFDGVEVSAGAGTFDSRKMRLSGGKRYESGAEVLLSLSYFQNEDVSSAISPEIDDFDSDFDKNRTLFGKFSYGSFQTEIVYGFRDSGAHVHPYSGLINDYDEFEDEKLFINAGYSAQFGTGWTVELNGTYNKAYYRGTFPYLDYYDQFVEEYEYYPGSWLSSELRLINTDFTDHRVLFGLEGHWDLDMKSEGAVIGEEPYFFREDKYNSYSVYLQDDITLTDSVILLLGGRYDNTEFGSDFNPRLGLIWQPQPETTIKALYGSAFRTPNFFEAGVNEDAAFWTGDSSIGAPELETIKTVELALEHYLTSSTRLSGSLYHYRLDDIIEENFSDDWVFTFENGDSIEATGFELELEKRFEGGTRLDLNYALQRTENSDGERLSNSPAHQLKFRSSIPLWLEGLRMGLETQYTSHRMTEEGLKLDGFWLVNLTMTYDLNEFIGLSASVYNLGDNEYYDPGRALLGAVEGIEQEGRSFYFQVNCKF